MSHPTTDDIDFYLKQLEPIVGWKVVNFAQDNSEGFYSYLGLVLQKGNKKKILWLLSDDEGNAPGSFELADLT